MTIDEMLSDDLDDLLTFRLYLAGLQGGEAAGVDATEALEACDRLIARLGAQRWIAVRGAEAEGRDLERSAASLEEAKRAARAVIAAKIDARG